MKVTSDNLRIQKADNGYILSRDVAIDHGPSHAEGQRWVHKTTHNVFGFGEEDALIQYIEEWTDNEPEK